MSCRSFPMQTRTVKTDEKTANFNLSNEGFDYTTKPHHATRTIAEHSTITKHKILVKHFAGKSALCKTVANEIT